MARVCNHINELAQVKVGSKGVCEECIKTGDKWMHLRTCQHCGITLCCDSSPNQHASKHFRKTSHPVVASAETGENWLYCYQDDQFFEY